MLLRTLLAVSLLVGFACGDDDGPSPGGSTDAGGTTPDGGGDTTTDAGGGETGPFVCQAYAYECPDEATLAACEASITGTDGCAPLPLVDCTRPSFQVQGTCASAAETCAVGDGSSGYCTHACSSDAQCPLVGGGLGTCTETVPGVRVCQR